MSLCGKSLSLPGAAEMSALLGTSSFDEVLARRPEAVPGLTFLTRDNSTWARARDLASFHGKAAFGEISANARNGGAVFELYLSYGEVQSGLDGVLSALGVSTELEATKTFACDTRRIDLHHGRSGSYVTVYDEPLSRDYWASQQLHWEGTIEDKDRKIKADVHDSPGKEEISRSCGAKACGVYVHDGDTKRLLASLPLEDDPIVKVYVGNIVAGRQREIVLAIPHPFVGPTRWRVFKFSGDTAREIFSHQGNIEFQPTASRTYLIKTDDGRTYAYDPSSRAYTLR
jgi:hypothetical protein